MRGVSVIAILSICSMFSLGISAYAVQSEKPTVAPRVGVSQSGPGESQPEQKNFTGEVSVNMATKTFVASKKKEMGETTFDATFAKFLRDSQNGKVMSGDKVVVLKYVDNDGKKFNLHRNHSSGVKQQRRKKLLTGSNGLRLRCYRKRGKRKIIDVRNSIYSYRSGLVLANTATTNPRGRTLYSPTFPQEPCSIAQGSITTPYPPKCFLGYLCLPPGEKCPTQGHRIDFAKFNKSPQE